MKLAYALLVAVLVGCGTTTEIVDRPITIPPSQEDTTVTLDGGDYYEETGVSLYSEDYLSEYRILLEKCKGEAEVVLQNGERIRAQFSMVQGETKFLRDSLGRTTRRVLELKKQLALQASRPEQTIVYRDTTTYRPPPVIQSMSIWEKMGLVVFLVGIGFIAGIIFKSIK